MTAAFQEAQDSTLAPEQASLDRKKEIYNAFSLTSEGVERLARDIDRLALRNTEHRRDIDLLEQEPDKTEPVSGTLRGYYDHIIDAATVVPDSECEELWGAITDGRLTSVLSNLARGYRYIKAQGVLTEYVRPELGATASYNRYSETTPPINVVRRPISLSEDDVDRLRSGPDEEKTTFLSEMLDPYRFRHDKDAPADEVSACEKEKTQIIELLESMQPSQGRDLLATEAWKYFRHHNINDPELATHSIGLIDSPELVRVVRATDEHLSKHTPNAIMGRFRDSGTKALQSVENQLHLSNDIKSKIAAEAAEAEEDISLTINIPLRQLMRVLFDSHRILPIGETKNSGGNDIETDRFRREVESRYSIYDENAGDVLERPVYAAVARGEDERLHGAIGARSYGDCVVTLKPEVARDRTTYTYGDSANTYLRSYHAGQDSSSMIMTYREVPRAKIIFDEYDPNPRRLNSESAFDPADRYIEAQVLGGVEIDDIESITLPVRRAYEVRKLLPAIHSLYPSLNVKVLVDRKTAEQNQKNIEKTTQKLGVDFLIEGTS